MKRKIETIRVKKAFTLVEVLTVLAIIALVIGILVPGLNTARRKATDIKQKGELHNMEVALELFKNDYGAYPESQAKNSKNPRVAGAIICGAQQFTEALVGRDLKGFDPKSTWNAPLEQTNSDKVIYANAGKGSSQPQISDSLNRRKGPYYKLDYCGAYLPEQLYGTYSVSSGTYTPIGDIFSASDEYTLPSGIKDYAYRAPVITDLYKTKKVYLETGRSVHAGTPILYFKANVSDKSRIREISEVYDINDNYDLIKMGTIESGGTMLHYFDEIKATDVPKPGDPSQKDTLNGIKYFNYVVTNPKIETFDKPYNAESFILMSAGDDGMFGTADDITNLGN